MEPNQHAWPASDEERSLGRNRLACQIGRLLALDWLKKLQGNQNEPLQDASNSTPEALTANESSQP
jgi:hypothetical protein